MDGDKLTLEMCGEFGDCEAVLCDDAADGVGVGFAFGGALEIEETGIPGGDLHASVA